MYRISSKNAVKKNRRYELAKLQIYALRAFKKRQKDRGSYKIK